jgi:hypothetical protein
MRVIATAELEQMTPAERDVPVLEGSVEPGGGVVEVEATGAREGGTRCEPVTGPTVVP